MRVRGDVRFNAMTDNQSVNLFGRDSVEVIMGSGSVHLSGQSPDQLAGNLTIEADDIVSPWRGIAIFGHDLDRRDRCAAGAE